MRANTSGVRLKNYRKLPVIGKKRSNPEAPWTRVAPAMSVPAELSATSPTAVRDVFAQAHRHADVQESDDIPRRRRRADQHG
jgi:hypothetical protein